MDKKYCQFETRRKTFWRGVAEGYCMSVTAGIILLVLYLLLHTTWGVFLP